MKIAKVLAGTSAVLFSAIFLTVFQLGAGILAQNQLVYAAQPFATVVPVDPDFEEAIDEDIEVPTPLPTVGAGQYYEGDDPNRPEALWIDGGDELTGYGPLNEEQTLYLMWVTDHRGTHYRVVDSTSQILFGTVDPVTGERRDNGFDQKIGDRETLLGELEDINTTIRNEERASDVKNVAGIALAGIGAGICIFATLGVCGVAAAVFGGAALTFIAAGASDSVDVFNSIDEKAEKMDQIDDLQGELVHSLTRPEPPLPDS